MSHGRHAATRRALIPSQAPHREIETLSEPIAASEAPSLSGLLPRVPFRAPRGRHEMSTGQIMAVTTGNLTAVAAKAAKPVAAGALAAPLLITGAMPSLAAGGAEASFAHVASTSSDLKGNTSVSFEVPAAVDYETLIANSKAIAGTEARTQAANQAQNQADSADQEMVSVGSRTSVEQARESIRVAQEAAVALAAAEAQAAADAAAAAEAEREAAEKAAADAAAREQREQERAASRAATRASESAPKKDSTPKATASDEAVATPAGDASLGERAVALAKQYTDTYYVYGGTTPAGFDCSGFTQYVYGKLGVDLPRTAAAQAKSGTRVSASKARPGDLVAMGEDAHHIGIYVGDGMMIDSPRTGKSIQVRAIWDESAYFVRVS